MKLIVEVLPFKEAMKPPVTGADRGRMTLSELTGQPSYVDNEPPRRVAYTLEMSDMSLSLNNPKAIAEAGERIYASKFRHDLEASHTGEYVAINVGNEMASMGVTPEMAFESARKDDPQGIFHLVRVGYAGAFQLSYQYGQNGSQDWLFG